MHVKLYMFCLSKVLEHVYMGPEVNSNRGLRFHFGVINVIISVHMSSDEVKLTSVEI